MTLPISPRLLLWLGLAATALLYWPGLAGPFLLDDHSALLPVELWRNGQQGWLQTLLPNPESIVYSRPVAMASFMLTTWLGGVTPFPYKLGNLIVHLGCGLLVAAVLRACFRRDPHLRPVLAGLAAVAAVVWLVHPLHVSTVLYAVQRMAQLSAAATLGAVLVYLHARCQLEAGRHRAAAINLFVSFPALLAVGMLSKQNAAVAPFLCLVFELAYFRNSAATRSVVGTFFAVFALVPLLAATAMLVLSPERLLAGYAAWDFTLEQRLLTQPRVLLDYIGMWLIPRTPLMGLYTDDYLVSSGWLSPPTTTIAIGVLAATSVAAAALRHRSPSLFAGWFFYLGAHGVESTFLPLEMYYEHRNYLPALGLLLALAGVGSLAAPPVVKSIQSPKRLALLLGTGMVLTLAFATLGRVLVWKSDEALVMQGLAQHPDSLRASMDASVVALWRADYPEARTVTATMRASSLPRNRMLGHLQEVAVGCLEARSADPSHLAAAATLAQPRLTVYEVQAARTLVNVTRKGDCGDVRAPMIADTLVSLLAAAESQPETADVKYAIRTMAAQLYARGDLWVKAEPHAETAWRATHYPPAGALLVDVYLRNGKVAEAAGVLETVTRSVRPYDSAAQAAVRRLQSRVAEARAAP